VETEYEHKDEPFFFRHRRPIRGQLTCSSRRASPIPTSNSFSSSTLTDWTSSDTEEILVADVRAQLTPSQMVERKLQTLLNGRSLPVSHLQISLPRLPSRSA